MEFRIGILGATGYIGTPYREEIRSAAQNARIVALCARRRDRLEAAARIDGAEMITDDWQQVVSHPDVNLVLVLTPDALHFDPVMECVRHGKHVFCEKPIGTNAQQAYEMWSAVRQRNLSHFVPFWSRYVPVIQRAKQIVDAGRLGDVRAIIYRWHNPRPLMMPFTWRDDAALSAAGSIADVGSHAYDTLRYLLGQEARRILTHARVVMPAKPDIGDVDLNEAISWGSSTHRGSQPTSTRRGTAPDYAQLCVEFASGAVASILLSHASYVRKGFAPEIELHGTLASLSVDRIAGELQFADSPDPATSLEVLPNQGPENRFERHVFPALQQRLDGQPCDHPGMHDGWRVQIFTDAAMASLQRSTWVELTEFDQP